MKEIQLTQGKVALVDDEDFEWLSQWKWTYLKAKKRGYAVHAIYTGTVRKSYLYMHRVVMNAPKGAQVDHKDLDGLNNQKVNLRLCNNSENHMNQAPHKGNKFKGITWIHNKWVASIGANGKVIYLGRYLNPEDAARAYDKAAKQYFGEFARTNFPT